MAVFEYDEHGSAYDDPYGRQGAVLSQARRWVSIAGAASSLALVVGLAYWGYALAVRDVTGVPVMRAVAGAMRIAPADPGGEQALNQGLTVNAVVATGTSAKLADTVTLAPVPVDLQPLDVPVADPSAEARGDALPQDVAILAPQDDAPAPDLAPQAAPVLTQDSVDAAVAAALSQSPADAGISPALRPQPRPADLGTAALQPIASLAPAIVEKDSSAIPVGTLLAQFDAYPTPDLARAKFAQLQESFGGLMVGKAMVVQPVQINGRAAFRLRVEGLATEAEAQSFCAALQAKGTECVPLAQR
ncbi:MAG: SPOR domain-containing protein [Pseudomonadota bacterium]